MKKILATVFALSLAGAAVANPVLYNDATGDLGIAVNNLDISSVQISHTASDLTFLVTINDDIAVTFWGNYMIGIDSVAGGDTAGNGWARPISMSDGMDYWIGAWVNTGGGHQVWDYSTSSWVEQAGSPRAVTLNQFSFELSVPLSDLGLSIGDSFDFDVYSSGGGASDGAVDALGLGSATISNWGDAYDSGANTLS